MSVLIKGMKMPDGCPFCPLSHWTRGTDEFAGCNIVPGKRYAMLNDIAFAVSLAKSRPGWCPLIEIPPHGRLNVIEPYMQHDEDDGFDELIKPSDIDYMHTPSVEEIIEADGLDSFIKHFED